MFVFKGLIMQLNIRNMSECTTLIEDTNAYLSTLNHKGRYTLLVKLSDFSV
jgi:hypothetical protein